MTYGKVISNIDARKGLWTIAVLTFDNRSVMNDVGARIKRARIGRGLTQEALAERIDVHRATVNSWESEGGGTPRGPTLEALSRELGVSKVYLLTGQEPMPDGDTVPLRAALRMGAPALDEDTLDIVERIVRALEIEREGPDGTGKSGTNGGPA